MKNYRLIFKNSQTMESLYNNTEEDNARALAKEKHQRLFKQGMMWLLAGGVLMGLSFAINFILYHSDGNFHTMMYVLTSVAAIMITKGLVDILGF